MAIQTERKMTAAEAVDRILADGQGRRCDRLQDDHIVKAKRIAWLRHRPFAQ